MEAECQSSSKVFRYQKVLQATSFHLLASAVGKSPSVLGTIDASKAEKVARLSGAAWPVHDPKVPQRTKECHCRKNKSLKWVFRAGSRGGAAAEGAGIIP